MRIDVALAWRIFVENWPMFYSGIQMTLAFALVGTVAGLILGLFIGAIHASLIDPLDPTWVKVLKHLGHLLTRFYVWVFRGTPMMIQAIFLYTLLKPVLGWTGFQAGLWIISINTGAYMAEIVRSGIQSVDGGQAEAAKSLGLSNRQTMLYIIFPQAIKNTFPSIGNQFIVNIKDSCMLNAIAVTELYFQASSIAGSNMRFIEVYLITTLIYLILTTLASALLNLIERRVLKNKAVSYKDFSA